MKSFLVAAVSFAGFFSIGLALFGVRPTAGEVVLVLVTSALTDLVVALVDGGDA